MLSFMSFMQKEAWLIRVQAMLVLMEVVIFKMLRMVLGKIFVTPMLVEVMVLMLIQAMPSPIRTPVLVKNYLAMLLAKLTLGLN